MGLRVGGSHDTLAAPEISQTAVKECWANTKSERGVNSLMEAGPFACRSAVMMTYVSYER